MFDSIVNNLTTKVKVKDITLKKHRTCSLEISLTSNMTTALLNRRGMIMLRFRIAGRATHVPAQTKFDSIPAELAQ